MPLALTSTDNADRTGLTVTVAGADALSTVTFWAVNNTEMRVGSQLGWVNVGSRVADGTKLLALDPGYWLLYASGTVSAAPAVSTPIQGVASLADVPLLTAIRNACVARIQTVDFTPCAGAFTKAVEPRNIVGQWKLDAKSLPVKVKLPAVVVAPFGNTSDERTGPNNQDDIGYGMIVALIAAVKATEETEEDTFGIWTERIRKSLINQRLDGIPQHRQMFARLDPRPTFDWGPDREPYGKMVCWNAFRFITRETRGI